MLGGDDVAGHSGGFTLVEVLVTMVLVFSLISISATVISSVAAINGKTNRAITVEEVAYRKVQDYINTSFDAIPIGLSSNSYEVEDFSDDSDLQSFNNTVAKVFVYPESVVDTIPTEVTNTYSKTIAADASYSNGSEYYADVHDPGNCCHYQDRLSDNNPYNLVYNNRRPGSTNQNLPAIDIQSPQPVSTIRVNWYSSLYGATDFRIEASNNLGNWTTIVDNLSMSGAGLTIGDYPQDIPVSGTYRYWRFFCKTGVNSTWVALSELEAFSASTGDIVEQSSSGNLDFSSSTLDLTESGGSQQAVGMRFKTVDVDQGTTIDNAYVQFTASSSNSGSVSLRARGVDVDTAPGWSGTSAVTNAVTTSGTSASTTWNPSSWSSGASGTAQQLDVTSIVQEIINRGGWSSGNDMAFAIQHISGSSKRVAQRSAAPTLVIEWSETTTINNSGTYVDDNGDGDADNPTLLRVNVNITYDTHNGPEESELSTFIHKFGLGN